MTSESFEILDLVGEAVFVRDFDGRIKAWNKASETLYGYSREAAVGQLADAILRTVYPISDADVEASCLATGHWEGQVKRKSAQGNQMLVHVRLSVQYDLTSKPIYIVETGREAKATNVEPELRLSEARYRNLFQAMAASFWELDFSDVNQRLRALRKSGVVDFRKYFTENPEEIREMMGAARVVDVNDQTVTLFGRGNKEELLGNLKPFWPDESTNAFAEAMLSGIARKPHYWTECKMRRIDGGIFDALFTIAYPPDLSGWTSMVAVIDITERNRAQEMLQRVQSDFAHAARVSMLGELTASIAHEVNQPLTAIAINGEAGLRWLARAEPEINEVRKLTKQIVADARRAADVIARIRSMAAHRAPERNLVSLDEVIREALLFIQHELQSHAATVVHEPSTDLPLVLADRTQLQQVIVNLTVNAMQAMVQSGASQRNITIRTRLADNGRLACVVEDSGPGINSDNFARLFDSFFTTKQHGMGMGLPICRSIVEAHGGYILAENVSPSGGARFSFVLPVPDREPCVRRGRA
ncbi:sensor histidine kinase [Bradyrhizobium sp. AZCC 1693]|uniref:sensor histidine kinase n=1 Tax=Bradyrhizobium sp. AZCC 1693 TaxID=3117029 RepID=UPI002FF26852